jgi:ammonia channel protein AmtB
MHAGLVQGWAAMVMGVLAGSVPWYTMMILHKRSRLLQHVDDTLGVIHTHGVAGLLGGLLTGLFADPTLCALFLPVTNTRVPGRLLRRRRRRRAARQAAGGRALHHRMERGRHLDHLRRHQRRRPAAHDRGQARGR